jgi:hypothetical protein
MSETPSAKDMLIRTLVASGFIIEKVEPKPNFTALLGWSVDQFGVPQRHQFAFAEERQLPRADVEMLTKLARRRRAAPVVIGQVSPGAIDADPNGGLPGPDSVTVRPLGAFLARLGGGITSYLPLEPEYASQLSALGRNQLPIGLTGKADDLFEAYVAEGLAFLLQARVVRYGQERLFEAMPDGIVLGANGLTLPYDAKAYKDGYKMVAGSVRQFADYVRQLRQRYSGMMEPVHAFVVLSGFFQGGQAVFQERYQEMYAEAQVPLVYLDADTLGELVRMFVQHPAYRATISWRSHFSRPAVSAEAVLAELTKRKQDGILPTAARVLP